MEIGSVLFAVRKSESISQYITLGADFSVNPPAFIESEVPTTVQEVQEVQPEQVTPPEPTGEEGPSETTDKSAEMCEDQAAAVLLAINKSSTQRQTYSSDEEDEGESGNRSKSFNEIRYNTVGLVNCTATIS